MSEIKVNNIQSLSGTNGPVISGTVEMNSTGAMALPRGDTAYRGGRGRGLFFGGNSPTYYNEIQYITIATTGDTTDFGDMTRAHTGVSGASSSTRMVLAGGYHYPSGYHNIIDYITMSSTGNAFDFGDLSKIKNGAMPASDGVRGIFAGGQNDTQQKDIEFVQIASKGNSAIFGEIVSNRGGTSGCNSTRGIFMGGVSPAANNIIEYITMATTGDALDFGDTTTKDGSTLGITSNSIRAIRFTSDYSTTTNRIDYVTIASLGNSIDFGDQNVDGFNGGASLASPTRAVAGGGYNGSSNRDWISYVEINTTGNAQDFGDLRVILSSIAAGSDSHGGLG